VKIDKRKSIIYGLFAGFLGSVASLYYLAKKSEKSKEDYRNGCNYYSFANDLLDLRQLNDEEIDALKHRLISDNFLVEPSEYYNKLMQIYSAKDKRGTLGPEEKVEYLLLLQRNALKRLQ